VTNRYALIERGSLSGAVCRVLTDYGLRLVDPYLILLLNSNSTPVYLDLGQTKDSWTTDCSKLGVPAVGHLIKQVVSPVVGPRQYAPPPPARSNLNSQPELSAWTSSSI